MAQAIALSRRGSLRARQAQTASGRPPSITDVTSTDPLPYVAGTHARQGRLRSPWQNCMALEEILRLQAIASDRAGVIMGLTKFIRLLLQTAILGGGAWLAIHEQISPGLIIAGSIMMGR